jgi:hypothetical protein
MRRALTLLVAMSALLMPCFGCESKPDPREREDFVDTTDPSALPALEPTTGAPGEAGPAAPKQ